MSYFDVANSSLVYLLVIAVIVFVFVLSAIFTRKAWKRGLELGFEKEVLKRVVKQSLVFTLVPSIAIVIGLFALAPALGIPWPWLRLSVIGSVSYELMAADMAVSGMNMTLAQASSGGPEALGNIMIVMTVGIMAGMIMLLIFGKGIMNKVSKLSQSKSDFAHVVMACFMVALAAVFVPGILAKGVIYILTFATSLAVTAVQAVIIQKFKVNWLKDFVLSFSLVIGMASSILWTAVIG